MPAIHRAFSKFTLIRVGDRKPIWVLPIWSHFLRRTGVHFVGKWARSLFDPMESDQRSSFLFGRIFFDEPLHTSSENAFCLVAFSSTNRRPLRRKMLFGLVAFSSTNHCTRLRKMLWALASRCVGFNIPVRDSGGEPSLSRARV